ncbi:hypothetical protein [Spirosoma sp. KNUC1025]|uniref:hypothetical protein n=1 Tax=Spirosoma sp. KNUC1025 TaxID=2894082 RepID=UPI00386A31AB|nr:hypothetical protein LN737_00695 [Spirosoma sp. KNUC1025]
MNTVEAQCNPLKTKRSQYMAYKQDIDLLPDFSSKLQYWREQLDMGNSYTEDELAFTRCLDLKTDEDLRQIHRYWMDWYRIDYANRAHAVMAKQVHNENEYRIAFCVRLFDNLKAELEIALSTAIRKVDVVQNRLTKITDQINDAGWTINGVSAPIAREIKELRYAFEANQPIDFNFFGESYKLRKACRLASIWDIIQYETFLKDQLVILNVRVQNTDESKSELVVADQRKIPIHLLEVTKTQILFINPGTQKALYGDLLEYVDCNEKGEAPELSALIFEQKAPSRPIVVTCSVEAFGATFYETRAVPENGAPILSQQLSKLFVRNVGKQIVPFKPSFLVKKLRESGQAVAVKKNTKN